MPIKPGLLQNLGYKFLYPFSALPIKMKAALNEAKIVNTSSIPLNISPTVIKKLQQAGFNGIPDLNRAIQQDIIGALKKTDAAKSLLTQDLLKNVVIRNGKAYIRQQDSKLNILKKAPLHGTLQEGIEKLGPGSADVTKGMNSAYFGKNLSPTDRVIEYMATPIDNPPHKALSIGTLVANAAKQTGTNVKTPILVNPNLSMYSASSQIIPETGRMILKNPGITTPFHEFSHMKDYRENKWKLPVAKFGKILADTAVVGTPVSILYGKEIADVIPGSVDDKIIKAFKYAGPEMFLAGHALHHYPELAAIKNTKKLIRDNPKYFEEISAMAGAPGITAEDMIDAQTLKGRTYPSGRLAQYGLLRLGTLPMYLAKQSSVNPTIGLSSYTGQAANMFRTYKNALMGLLSGVRDPEVLKGITYHDSANKYKNIGTVFPISSLASLVPIIALGEYFKDTKKPKHPIVGPTYNQDIKQGLGA